MPGTARKVNKRVIARMKPEMSPGRAGAGLWGHREEAGFPGEGNTPGKPKAEKRGSRTGDGWTPYKQPQAASTGAEQGTGHWGCHSHSQCPWVSDTDA